MEDISAPAATPAAAPSAPAPAAAPAMPTPMPSGGSSSFKDTFANINLVEIIFGILGSATLLSMIRYYNYTTKMGKAVNIEMQNKIDDLSIKVADLQSATQRDDLVKNGFTGFDGLF